MEFVCERLWVGEDVGVLEEEDVNVEVSVDERLGVVEWVLVWLLVSVEVGDEVGVMVREADKEGCKVWVFEFVEVDEQVLVVSLLKRIGGDSWWFRDGDGVWICWCWRYTVGPTANLILQESRKN